METQNKSYLDYIGLGIYDSKIKAYIAEEDAKRVSKDSNASAITEVSFVKIKTNSDGLVTGFEAVKKSDITNLGTLEAPSSNDKIFLVGIADNTATKPGTLNSNSKIYLEGGALKIDGEEVAVKSDVAKAVKFKGTLGEGGTISTLPTAGKDYEGFMYKVITDGTYAGKAAKVGDTFICSNTSGTTYEWILIPSGDEPAGTVTNIATGACLTGGPITSSGTISHDTMKVGGNPQAAADPSAIAVGYDAYGHVVAGGHLSIKSAGHTHGFTGTVSVNTYSAANTTVGISTNTKDVITGYAGEKKNLVVDTISGAETVAAGNRPTKTVFGTNATASKVSTAKTLPYYVPSSTVSAMTGFNNNGVAYSASFDTEDDTMLVLTPLTIKTADINNMVSDSSNVISQYTISDVTVPVVLSNAEVEVAKASSVKTFATGAITAVGTGAAVLTGLGEATTEKAVTSASLVSGATAGVSLVTSLNASTETKTVSGAVTGDGSHAHDINIG